VIWRWEQPPEQFLTQAGLLPFAALTQTNQRTAVLRQVAAEIEAALSDFYVVNELQCTYQGMMIAIPPHFWQGFADIPTAELAGFLQDLAAKVNLKRFLKAPRQKKKNRPVAF